jgi:hypothetical protein
VRCLLCRHDAIRRFNFILHFMVVWWWRVLSLDCLLYAVLTITTTTAFTTSMGALHGHGVK